MATIAKGVVRIDGKDNTQKAFNSAKKSAISLEKVMKAAALAVAAVAGAKAMGKMISSTLDLADGIGKLAKNTGMSVEFIQTYGRVMGEAGIDQNQADKSLETFNKRLGEMRLGVGAMKKPLEEYSEELSNQIMAAESSEEAVKILIGAMERMEDPAAKAALASAAFGTQVGKKMPAMMAEGAGSFDRAAQDILKTTTLMNAGQIEMAEKANDMMSRVGGAWGSMKDSIIVGAAGPIVKASEWILNTAYPAWQSFFQGVGEGWDKYAKPGIDMMMQVIGSLMEKLGPSLDMLRDGVNAVMGALGVAWERFAEPGMNRMLEFFTILAPYVEPIIDLLVATIETAFRVIGKVWELAKPGMDKFVEVVQNVWTVVGPIFEIGVAAIGEVLQLFGGFFSGVLDEVNRWVDGTSSLLDVFGAVWKGWVGLIDATLDVFKNLFGDLSAPVKAAFDAVTKIVGGAIDWIVKKVEWLASFLPDWMNPFADSAKKSSVVAQKSIGTASSKIGKHFDFIMDDVKDAAAGMKASFKSMTTAAASWATDFASGVTSKISSAWSSITGFFKGGSDNAVNEMKQMTTESVKEASKLNDGVSKEFAKVETYASGRMALLRGNVNKHGEGIVDDAVTHSWATDFSILVPGAFATAGDGVEAEMKEMEATVNAYGTSITDSYLASQQDMANQSRDTYDSMGEDAKGFAGDVESTLGSLFEGILKGDIEGSFKSLLDNVLGMVIKFASDVAAQFVTKKLFGDAGGGNALGMISKLFSGGGGGAAGGGSGGFLAKLGGLFGKGGTSSGIAGGAGSAGGAGGAAGAAGGGGLSAMAGAAVPLAIFGFGMYMSSKQAKKDEEEYLGIINDIQLAENMATEAIGNGYVGIGEKGGQAYVQVSEAMAKHLESTQKGIDLISGQTDAYGNMIVKAKDYDRLIAEAKWAETHMEAVDNIKSMSEAYQELGHIGQEETLAINMATSNLVDNQDMVAVKTAAMADGFIDAGEAMMMGIHQAAGMTSDEFEGLIKDTNAVQYGLTSMSAEGVKALAKIDTSAGYAAKAMESGFVSATDMARMGLSGLGEMSSEMFGQMIEYANGAQGAMHGITDAANAAAAASAKATGHGGKNPYAGHMTGTSFMVGGQGGLDNNLVAFKASNNERVTVETPEQQRNADNGKSSFSVEDLIEYVTKPIVGAVQKQAIIAASAARH